MTLTDPQQELFSFLLAKLKTEFGEGSVYDSVLPPDGTPYPFVYLGECRMNDVAVSKDYTGADVRLDIHVWSDEPKKRGTVSKMLFRVKRTCFSLDTTGNYSWRYDGSDENIFADNTTSTPLLHGVITAAFHLQGGRQNDY